MPTLWNNHCAYLDYCNSFYFPFRSKKDYFEHCFSCSTKSSLWILDIMFSVNLHMQELLTLPTGRNILYENFYCQWELAVTFWFCIKYIYLSLAKIYLSGTELCLSNKIPCPGKQRASQDTCFSAPPNLWVAIPCKYLPLVFTCKYYENRPQKPHPKPRPILDGVNH